MCFFSVSGFILCFDFRLVLFPKRHLEFIFFSSVRHIIDTPFFYRLLGVGRGNDGGEDGNSVKTRCVVENGGEKKGARKNRG